MIEREEQNQVNQHVPWRKFIINLLAMICIYATSAGVAIILMYRVAVWLGLTGN